MACGGIVCTSSGGVERRFVARKWSREEEVAADDEDEVDEDEEGGPRGMRWQVSDMVVGDKGQGRTGGRQEPREAGDGVVIVVMGDETLSRVGLGGRRRPKVEIK